MKKLITICFVVTVLMMSSFVSASTISFDTADIVSAIGSLNNATNQWGLWAVRAMPIVGGSGLYTITSGSTDQAGWGVSAPNGAFGNAPYSASNSVWFWDASGSEAWLASNPLYMIMDVSQDNFESYTFDGAGGFVGSYSPGGGGTWYASGYNGGVGGTNLVTAVSGSSAFSFSFTLGSGATWNGQWQFVVDGSRYTPGTYSSPGVWQEDFFGGYGSGGSLSGNTGAGYLVPEPGTLVLLGTAGLGLLCYAWRRRATA